MHTYVCWNGWIHDLSVTRFAALQIHVDCQSLENQKKFAMT